MAKSWKNTCKKCQSEYVISRRKEKPLTESQKEKIKEWRKQYYVMNKSVINQKNKEYRTLHREELAQKNKEKYQKNKLQISIESKKRREEFTQMYKKPCEKCGESRLYLIHFHHIDPKAKLFTIGKYSLKNQELLEEEVKKCVCLCPNCHNEFHYLYGSNPKDPIASLNEYLGRDVNGQF